MWLRLSPAVDEKHHEGCSGLETGSSHTSRSPTMSLRDHVLRRATRDGPGSTSPPRGPC